MSDIKDIDLSGPNQTGRLNDEIQILKAIRGVLELNSKVMEEFKTGLYDVLGACRHPKT
jgi:hypothetical protein